MRVWDPETEAELFPFDIHVSKYGVVDPEFAFLSDNRLAVHEPGIPDVGIAGGFVFDKPKVDWIFRLTSASWIWRHRRRLGHCRRGPCRSISLPILLGPTLSCRWTMKDLS